MYFFQNTWKYLKKKKQTKKKKKYKTKLKQHLLSKDIKITVAISIDDTELYLESGSFPNIYS